MARNHIVAQMERIVRSATTGGEEAVFRHYGRDDLHRYMDGAAERYLGYSFDRLLVAKADRGADQFVIELYHFGEPSDAYGIWSTDSVGERVGIGQNSAYGAGLLQFWRGSFYARVYHRKYSTDAREEVLAIGRALAAAIGEDGPLPEILAELPSEGVESPPVFFHEQPMLNYLYYLSDANLLRLGPNADAVFAEYEHEEAKARLLVVRYKGDGAKSARKAFVREYLETDLVPGPVVVQLENELWTGIAEPENRTLRVVLDATSRDLALELLKPGTSQ